jgi:hypothetical protein
MDKGKPFVVVEVGTSCFLADLGIVIRVIVYPVAGRASICAVVVELNEEHVELGTSDHFTHVLFWKWTLRSTGNNILLLRLCCEMLPEFVDTLDVALGRIYRWVLNIEVKSVNVDLHRGVGVVVTSVQRADTASSNIHRIRGSIGFPEEICQVLSILFSGELVSCASTAKGHQELLSLLLLTVIKIFLEVSASLGKNVGGRVRLAAINTWVSWARVDGVSPTSIGEVLAHQSICLSWECVDESERDNIDGRLVTESSKGQLVIALALSSHQSGLTRKYSTPPKTYPVQRHICFGVRIEGRGGGRD